MNKLIDFCSRNPVIAIGGMMLFYSAIGLISFPMGLMIFLLITVVMYLSLFNIKYFNWLLKPVRKYLLHHRFKSQYIYKLQGRTPLLTYPLMFWAEQTGYQIFHDQGQAEFYRQAADELIKVEAQVQKAIDETLENLATAPVEFDELGRRKIKIHINMMPDADKKEGVEQQ